MDSQSLDQFRNVLQKHHYNLVNQIIRDEQETRGTAERQPEDSGDMSTKSIERDLLFAKADSNHQMLRLIELALERIRRATFGTCTGCGDVISITRLKAVPWALYCIKCQKHAEKHTAGVT